jgi:hypothetical protein
MSRHPVRHAALVAGALVTLMLAGATAQNVLQQLNVSDTEARRAALTSITEGYVEYGLVRDVIKAMPGAARGAAVETGIAWARAYVSSPGFASEYARYREEHKPQPPEAVGSVDDELKQQLAKQQQDLDETRKNLASLPAEMRPQMEAVLKQSEDMMKDPAMLQMMRSSIEMNRAEAKTTYESDLRDWGVQYPADVRVLVATRLQAFLDASADVDFSAAVVDRGGRKAFADEANERKPGEWKLCYRAGREATMAARTAAAAWLNDLRTP